jgi:hypothetical protein
MWILRERGRIFVEEIRINEDACPLMLWITALLAEYPYWSFFDGKDERIDYVRATP